MALKNTLSYALLALPLAIVGVQAAAKSKPPPAGFVPTAASDPGLSAPSVDAGQALDVSVRSSYYPITPCRLADTRYTPGGETPFGQGETVGFWGWAGDGCEEFGCYESFGGSTEQCGIPSTATAIHVNFTIVAPKGNGFLRAWPNNVDEPGATVFAWDPGFGASNAVTVAICSDSTEDTDAIFYGELYANCPDPFFPTEIADFMVKIYGDRKDCLLYTSDAADDL